MRRVRRFWGPGIIQQSASLFEYNWLIWQIVTVSDDKIQITLLILRRGVFSSPAALWDHVAEFAEFTLPLSWGEGGNADCLIILRRYLQAVLPSREGEKGWRCYSHKSLKHADGWLLDYEWVGKLASFAAVQMAGEPGWVSLVRKYRGCWCSTEIGARVYERRCSVVFQSNWIFLTLTLFITLTILHSYHPFSNHR